MVGWRQDPIAPIPDAPIYDPRRACGTLHDHHDLLRTWTCWRSSDRATWNDDAFQVDARLFERAIAHANELNPAFVIICGDLVNRVGHSGQIAEFQHIASTLNPSISTLSRRYLVAGYHDVGNEPTQESLRAYRATFGPDGYSFR